MTEKKKRFHIWEQIRRKSEKEELNIDEEALREFEAVLHAELEAEDSEEPFEELEAVKPAEVDDEQESLDELEMEVERSVELHPDPEVEESLESDRTVDSHEEVDSKELSTEELELDSSTKTETVEATLRHLESQKWQDPLPVRTPLEDSLKDQLEELKQIKSGLPEDRRAWIHEEAVRSANHEPGEVHYRRRRRQPPKSSQGKWLWIVFVMLILAALWFFRGTIMAALPSFERTQAAEELDPEMQLRERVELFFSTAKVIEAESMTTFFSMTTMNDPKNYEENRDAINALIDLKTSFELVQELEYLGISGLQMENIDGAPARATVSLELNSVDSVLKETLAETVWLYREEMWVLDADQYLIDLKEAQIAQNQVPVLPKEDNSDLPAGEVVKEEPVEETPEEPLDGQPSPTAETDDGFIQAGGFTYATEDDRDFSMLTLKFGIQREGFEKMVFTSSEAKANQSSDAPSFEMWLSESNRKMTVIIEGDLTNLEIADYRRFSALIQDIEVDRAERTMVFTFKNPVQVRPYEWKGLLIMDYEKKE